jgi:hypothetical protein
MPRPTHPFRASLRTPAFALGGLASAVLWGVIEFVALSQSRWRGRERRRP